jgi:drug/metabolite transporter (DMT)-like permease
VSPRALAYVAIVLQTAISAATYVVAKRALAELAGLELAWLRFGGAGLCFGVVLLALGRSLRPPPGTFWRFTALGVLGFPVNQGLFLFGLARTTPTHAAITYALTPTVVLVLARVILHEGISPAKALGVVVAFLGVVCVLLERGMGSVTGPLTGDLFVLGATVAWSSYTVLLRGFAREHGGIVATSWALFWGPLVAMPLLPVMVRAPAQLATVTTTVWACVAFLTLLSSVAGYLMWGFALRQLDAARVAIFANLQPVGTVLLAWFFYDEKLTPMEAAGAALVLIGVTLSQRSLHIDASSTRGCPAPPSNLTRSRELI